VIIQLQDMQTDQYTDK